MLWNLSLQPEGKIYNYMFLNVSLNDLALTHWNKPGMFKTTFQILYTYSLITHHHCHPYCGVRVMLLTWGLRLDGPLLPEEEEEEVPALLVGEGEGDREDERVGLGGCSAAGFSSITGLPTLSILWRGFGLGGPSTTTVSWGEKISRNWLYLIIFTDHCECHVSPAFFTKMEALVIKWMIHNLYKRCSLLQLGRMVE